MDSDPDAEHNEVVKQDRSIDHQIHALEIWILEQEEILWRMEAISLLKEETKVHYKESGEHLLEGEDIISLQTVQRNYQKREAG